MPNGITYRNGSLYIIGVNRILRFDNIESGLRNSYDPVIIYDKYPTDMSHGRQFIRFGPDGYLYIPVGAPCNICDSSNSIYATITRIKPDGLDMEIFAHGIRNTLGFDWNPLNNELWFTDHGRDMPGDDSPPDESIGVSGNHAHAIYRIYYNPNEIIWNISDRP